MERSEYVAMAAVEDRMWFYRALHAHVWRELSSYQLPPTATVLDAGCGTGGLLASLSRAAPTWSLTGVDLEPLACDYARQRGVASIHQGSVTALPFADGSFDAVVSADVLGHVEEDTWALREFFRVVRPGGCVVVNVAAYHWLWSYHDEAVHSVRRYGRTELLTRLREAAWTEVRSTHWNMLPLPLIIARRKLWRRPTTSDVRLYPAPVERVLNGVMALEQGWLRGNRILPAGCSILASAQKPPVAPARAGNRG